MRLFSLLLASTAAAVIALAQPAIQPAFNGSTATGDHYGSAVATDGSTLVIASYTKIDFWKATYPNNVLTWVLATRLDLRAHVTGIAVYKTSAVAKYANGAYAFESNGSTWTQTQDLSLPDGIGLVYSAGVALRNNTAAVGAPNYLSARGRVYLLNRTAAGAAWSVSQVITPSSGADYFGACVQLGVSGTTSYLLASAPVAGNYNGLVYSFRLSNGAYTYSGAITSPAAGVARFGEGLTTSGASVIAVGAPAAMNFQGAVYLYTIGFNSSGNLTYSQTQMLTSTATNPLPFLFGESIQITSMELVIASRNSLTWYPFSGGVAGTPTALPIGAYSDIYGSQLSAVTGLIFSGDQNANKLQGIVSWYR